jgi:type III restriction enzyme
MTEHVTPIINAAALEPLFAPWEEPTRHRVRAATPGAPPDIKTYRRPSPVRLVNPLRAAVKEWRDLRYPGASETTRELLAHWFERPHRRSTPSVKSPYSGTIFANAKRSKHSSIFWKPGG